MATGTPIIVYSGCKWTDGGGAQRPVAFVKELQRRGHEALYCSCWDPLPYVPDRPGVLIIAWSAHFAEARRLIDAGWSVIYDYLDDWAGFVDAGDLPESEHQFDQEWELIERADLVIGSATPLVERAIGWGKRAELILNAGPNQYEPFEKLLAERKTGDPTLAVYAGHIMGSWFDWRPVEALARRKENTTLLIGQFQAKDWDGNVVDACANHRLHYTRWLGMLEHKHCLGVIGGCDVGLVPFQGKLCHSVDPIKYYDYLSRGLWTVTTPDVHPLVGRRYTITAEPADFPLAVLEAADRTYADPPDPGYYYENTWEQRVDRLLELVDEVAPEHHGRRNGKVRGMPDPGKVYPLPLEAPAVLTRDLEPRNESVSADDCKVRISVQIPGGACNMRRHRRGECPYCSESGHIDDLEPIQGTVTQWVNGLRRIGRKWGPAYFNFCFGEPLGSEECIRIIGAVARENRVDLVTNALAEVEALDGWPRNGNIGISTSWHPQAWESVEAFMARREEYRAAGFFVGTVGVVAWPPYLKKIAQWDEEFTRLGVEDLGVNPFWGEWRGLRFPESYSPGERDLLRAYSERSYIGEIPMRTWDCPEGLLCSTGRDYAYIGHGGDVQRCSMVSEPTMGNLLAGDVQMLPKLAPCTSETCPCPDMWKYIDDGKKESADARRTRGSEEKPRASIVVTAGISKR